MLESFPKNKWMHNRCSKLFSSSNIRWNNFAIRLWISLKVIEEDPFMLLILDTVSLHRDSLSIKHICLVYLGWQTNQCKWDPMTFVEFAQTTKL